MDIYQVRTDGACEPIDSVAEKIETLAQELRRNPKSANRVIQIADAIMHLAADIKLTTENIVKGQASAEAPGA